MKRRFEEAQLQTAAFLLANQFEDVVSSAQKLSYPIIVKPVMGARTDATRVFHCEADLHTERGQQFFHRLRHPKTTSEKAFPVIVEKFLDVHEEYHCDGYVMNGEVKFVRVAKYLKPVIDYASGILGSITMSSTDPLAKQIIQMHTRAIRAVGIENGVTHFEVFDTANGLIAGEIASRPGGGGIPKMLRLQDGFDSWKAHIARSLGEQYVWQNTGICSPDEQIAQLMLPIKRGVVRSISTSKDVEIIPGYIESEMKLTVGKAVDVLLDSAATSGLIFVKITQENKIEDVLSATKAAFFLEVDFM